ncbi:hypothetical protein LUZ60_002240 [Juncus effusus]|nr:hypothetical protein LUZ60_002240 [Juncus effusus]
MAQLDYGDIEIRTDDPLAKSIREKINKLRFNPIRNSQYTIFRVPSYIREINKNFYEPRIVSIGPYHHGGAHLKAMEEQKWHYAHKLLTENPDVTLDMYLKELRELENAARRCYYERIEMCSDEFVTMLLLDSVFIIQVVVNWSFRGDEDIEDIVYDIPWNVPLIKSDLLMLENQIPFFIMEKVFELFSTRDEGLSCSSPPNSDTMSDDQESEQEKASLFDVLVGFLEHGNESFEIPGPNNSYDHLLHFYYERYMSVQDFPIKCYRNSLLKKLKEKKVFTSLSSSLKRFTMRKDCGLIPTKRPAPRMIPCATELKEAGIAFKRSKSKSIFDVNFSSGVLQIPYIPVEENTRPRIMNLIAFEQCSRQKGRPLTSYAVLMDCIINTPRDVLILQQRGIIENKLADEGEAAMFFNQLRYCSYLDYDEHHLAGLFGEVKKYCESKWQKYRAKLCRDYFNSPWAILSFFAAVLLLFLTAIQSVYGVLGYYQQHH